MTVNDGTGPRYDRPSRITRETVRRAEPEYPEWDAYQALLADGMDDADARVAIWPDHALLYVAGEDGDDVLLPVGKDGFAIIPEGYEAPEGDDEGDGDDETGDGEAVDGADGSESAEAPQTPTEPEIDAEAGADGAEADPEAQAEDDADEIADGDDKPADEGYDPSTGTVDEVRAYLADHPSQTEYVLERERGGKARVSLIGA